MMRVGLGVDAHKFDPARPLVLGGVTIPDAPGLAGHSDADVLCHAVADALLGAAGLGDLGDHFPADDRWRDAPSIEILKGTAALLSAGSYVIENIDATLIAERPRLSPYREAMIEHVARALEIGTVAVSIKASTTDGLGFAGRGEGIMALAVALLSAPEAVG